MKVRPWFMWTGMLLFPPFFFFFTSWNLFNRRVLFPASGTVGEKGLQGENRCYQAHSPQGFKDFLLFGWISFSPSQYLVFSGQWSRCMMLVWMDGTEIKMNILAWSVCVGTFRYFSRFLSELLSKKVLILFQQADMTQFKLRGRLSGQISDINIWHWLQNLTW